jgi:hypothetical protein
VPAVNPSKPTLFNTSSENAANVAAQTHANNSFFIVFSFHPLQGSRKFRARHRPGSSADD